MGSWRHRYTLPSIDKCKKAFSKKFTNSLLTNDDDVWRRTCVCGRAIPWYKWVDAFIHVHCAHTKFNRQSYIEEVSDNFFWETILSCAVASFLSIEPNVDGVARSCSAIDVVAACRLPVYYTPLQLALPGIFIFSTRFFHSLPMLT